MICKLMRDSGTLFHVISYETMFYYTMIKVLNFPVFWEMRYY